MIRFTQPDPWTVEEPSNDPSQPFTVVWHFVFVNDTWLAEISQLNAAINGLETPNQSLPSFLNCKETHQTFFFFFFHSGITRVQ